MRKLPAIAIHRLIIFAGLFFLYPVICHADFERNKDCPRNGVCFVRIFNTISAQDVRAFTQIASQLPKEYSFFVSLDSTGGDVDSAMAIGRILRARRAAAFVSRSDKCVSACVLALAGATSRTVSDGSVAIHRLYTASTAHSDYDALQRIYRKMELDVRSYLREMNVPDSLYDAMMRIPSENAHVLSPIELETYHLAIDDPVAEDLANSKQAEKYGLTKPAYLQRLSRANKECQVHSVELTTEKRALMFMECREAIFRGRR